MVHTVSGITLHRLRRMAASGDAPYEAREVIGRMVDLVRQVDPFFFEKVGCEELPADALPETHFQRPTADGDRFAREFDRRLNGRVSRLVDASPRAEESVAEAVRVTFGLSADELTDDEAIERVMNPALNRYRLEVHERVVPLAADARAASRVVHVREAPEPHRGLAGSAAPDGARVASADVVRGHRRARLRDAAAHRGKSAGHARCTTRAMRAAWDAKNRLLALGVPLEFAMYVLPNAKTLRMVESGSLLALMHKWLMRTCFNAQEEIYLASMDELDAVRLLHPRLARFIGPPCVVRNGLIAPRCTEGTHFCGIPVWRDFPAAVRRL